MFAFYKYRGSRRVVSIRGISAERVSELIRGAQEDLELGLYTAYRVERI